MLRKHLNRIKKIVCCVFLIYYSSAIAAQPSHWIDLSHILSQRTIHWATKSPFKLITLYQGNTPNHHYYRDHQLNFMAHAGTHVDAPNHFARHGQGVAAIPLQQLMGKAVVINVSQQVQHHRDYQIQVKDLLAWQKQHGKIKNNRIILFYTGFEKYWPNRRDYFGTAKIGHAAKADLHFPGLSVAAAKWLIAHRVKAVGIDTASIDYGQSQDFPVHQLLAKSRVPIFENLMNLNKLRPAHDYVIALPAKIAGASGAPLRIIATTK